MVKYALEDEMADEEMIQQEPVLDLADTSQGPDDTFEELHLRKRRAQLPDILSAGPLSGSTHQRSVMEDSAQLAPLSAAHDLAIGDNAGRSSGSPTSDAAGSELEAMSISKASYAESLRDEPAELGEAKTWPEQLAATLSRQHVLRQASTRSQSLASNRYAERKNNYTSSDLHHDLFGVPVNRTRVQEPRSNRGCAFSWGHGTQIVCAAAYGSGVQIQTLQASGATPAYGAQLEILQAHSAISTDAEGLPFASVKSSLPAQGLADAANGPYAAHCWSLSSALFDQLPFLDYTITPTDRLALESRLRKDAVSHWLQQQVGIQVRSDESQTQALAERIVLRLTGGQLADACALALSAGDGHIGTLLATGNGDRSIRADMVTQIATWKDDSTWSFIDPARRTIYQLLAGEVTNLDSYRDEERQLSSSAGLLRQYGWLRCLGLCLWFGILYDAGIDAALEQFRELLSHSHESSSSLEAVFHDLRYRLLELFADKDREASKQLFEPSTWQKASLDFVEPWLLNQFLASRDLSMLAIEDADRLTLSCCAQLEDVSRLDAAFRVALFLRLPTTRQSHALRLLSRLIGTMTPDDEAILLQQLKIPSSWINQARALNLRYQGSTITEAQCLLAAGLVDEAHYTLVQQIGPDCIISGQMDALKGLLALFTATEPIMDWPTGGQVYADAATMTQLTGREATSKLASQIMRALPSMTAHDFKQKVAVRELASICLPLLLMSPDDSTVEAVNTSEALFSVEARHALRGFRSLAA